MEMFNNADGSVVSNNNISDVDSSLFVSENDQNFLGKDWIPVFHPEKKPIIGQRFNNLDDGFEYYKEYGRVNGFDVRRSAEKSDRFGNTIRKYFVCSRAGNPDKSNSNTNPSDFSAIKRRRRTGSIKCECHAEVVLCAHVEVGFFVKKFIEEHNHPFAGKGGMQFLRCSRSLTEFHKRFILDAAKTNIGPSRAHSIFKSMVGSYEDVGATVVDFKNFSRDIKQYIGKHDADMIIQKFKDIQESSDKEFRFEYQTDSKNHLTQLFWADGVGRKNYEVFGDVVSFDATYRTNRYGMIFVPLIGINNHWKSITFGAFLLEHEDNSNYIWACEAFKKVFGKAPKCFITDQDLAMKVALDTCFPLVKHRLCMWHIMKKFPSKLGSLFCAESEFMDKINEFVWSDHATPSEFEQGWTNVVAEYGLTENAWLKDLYELRSYWIPAFFNDEPMVGLLRTTSRSESSNFYFSHYVQKGDTLSEFFLCYQSAIEKQRNVGEKMIHYDEFRPFTSTLKKIEKDAAALYTRAMFNKIQEEIKAGGGDIVIESMIVRGNTKTIRVKDPINQKRIFEVIVDMESNSVDCSCNLYIRVGYLCCHAFFCLGISGISEIPRRYLKNRWLKNAVERFSTLNIEGNSNESSVEGFRRAKTQDCWFEFQSCLSDAAGTPAILDYVKSGLVAMREHINRTINKPKTRFNSEQIGDMLESHHVENVTVLNPNQSNNKGSRKRLVPQIEKSIAGKKRETRKCRYCKEFAYHDIRNCPKKALDG